ncbi:MAG: SURF1 family protein [Gammaproteobacteria bacterium]
MTSQRGNWRFSPGRVPTLAVITLVPILVWLGIWQLQRAEYKETLAEDFAAGSETVFIDGSALVSTLEKTPRFQQVSLTGRYASDRQFLLDNMTDGGSAGYHVLTPFLAEGSDAWVLVNRGWIPKSFGTTILPDIAVDESKRRVTGRVSRLPRPGLELETASGGIPEWPRVVQFPTAEELAQSLETDLTSRIVLLDASAEDGYLRNWAPTEFGPERHYGYALQWFALAATLVIIYVVLNVKRSGNDRR